jgi:DNA-binding Xre family transcriptional regulator
MVGLKRLDHAVFGPACGDMSRAEAARRVGIGSDELAKIERGETTQVRWVTLLKLMRAYGCSLQDLVEVRAMEPVREVRPAYARALEALRAGQLSPGLPPRQYTPERDADAETGETPSPEVAAQFDTPGPKRGRKAPFRPTAKLPA